MLFLSTPYNHPDKEVRTKRVRQTATFAMRRLQMGQVFINPTLYGLTLIDNTTEDFNDTGWQTWKNLCLAILDRCDALYVLMMEDWDKSIGVSEEIEHAKARGIPIYYLEPSMFE